MSADPFLAALARFEATRKRLRAVGQAIEMAEAAHGIAGSHLTLAAALVAETEVVRENEAALRAAITTAPTTTAGAVALLDLARRERDHLEPVEMAADGEHASPFIGATGGGGAAPPAAMGEPPRPSPTFPALHQERHRLRLAADVAAAAVMAGDTDADPRERAAQDALARPLGGR